MQQVSASAAQKDVIGAIVASAGPNRPKSDPNRWLGLAFIFVMVFAGCVYFREELYTVSRGEWCQEHVVLVHGSLV